ncbi:MAG: hypothetical protein CL946_08070 [Ectothiorhodospiraceae bacterium]|nr:hypothetical protein [Ectothiorhodospiraceae bacterium]
MNDQLRPVSEEPSILPSVLIGGGAIALISIVPVLNWVNCLCCAGVMAGAVFGVWYYKRDYPKSLPFGPKQGAIIGSLSGLVGGILYAILETIWIGLFMSPEEMDFAEIWEEAMRSNPGAGVDPEIMEMYTNLGSELFSNMFLLFGVLLVVSIIVNTGFGAIGGLIGGKIFKQIPTAPSPSEFQPVETVE